MYLLFTTAIGLPLVHLTRQLLPNKIVVVRSCRSHYSTIIKTATSNYQQPQPRNNRTYKENWTIETNVDHSDSSANDLQVDCVSSATFSLSKKDHPSILDKLLLSPRSTRSPDLTSTSNSTKQKHSIASMTSTTLLNQLK